MAQKRKASEAQKIGGGIMSAVVVISLVSVLYLAYKK